MSTGVVSNEVPSEGTGPFSDEILAEFPALSISSSTHAIQDSECSISLESRFEEVSEQSLDSNRIKRDNSKLTTEGTPINFGLKKKVDLSSTPLQGAVLSLDRKFSETESEFNSGSGFELNRDDAVVYASQDASIDVRTESTTSPARVRSGSSFPPAQASVPSQPATAPRVHDTRKKSVAPRPSVEWNDSVALPKPVYQKSVTATVKTKDKTSTTKSVTASSIGSSAIKGSVGSSPMKAGRSVSPLRSAVPSAAPAVPAAPKLLVVCAVSAIHDTGATHQETALRTELLSGVGMGCLRRKALEQSIVWENCTQTAAVADLLRVHEFAYLQHLERQCTGRSVAAASSSSLSPGPAAGVPSFYAPAGFLDGDTPMAGESLLAAKTCCGAAIRAVDAVMADYDGKPAVKTATREQFHRAFVIGRPPGHHAGPHGCVVSDFFWKRPDMASSGFCLLNTAAVAAAYARFKYGSSNPSRPPRVAIVDIDIHHGNGTEEIVKNLRPHSVFLPLPSSWAPVSVLSYKPWLNDTDSDDTFFSSIHLYAGENFYPCSGSDESSTESIVNIGLTPIGPGPWDQKARQRLTPAQRAELISLASQEMRNKVSSSLIPRLKSFGADLLIISAGFDAHHDDMYHFLDETDLHWLTAQLVDCVEKNDGRVVSILEGGYSLSSGPTSSRPRGVSAGTELDQSEGASVSVEVLPTSTSTGRAVRKPKRFQSAGGLVESPSSESESEPVTIGGLFAQMPGDGGLVKGVLAHAAALVDKASWR